MKSISWRELEEYKKVPHVIEKTFFKADDYPAATLRLGIIVSFLGTLIVDALIHLPGSVLVGMVLPLIFILSLWLVRIPFLRRQCILPVEVMEETMQLAVQIYYENSAKGIEHPILIFFELEKIAIYINKTECLYAKFPASTPVPVNQSVK
jgi:hypothetical protein